LTYCKNIQSVLAMLAISVCSAPAAGESFNFIQAGTDQILATLTTDGADPFDHSNIDDLSFSSVGASLFALDVGSYAGEFDVTFGTGFTDDASDELKGLDAGRAQIQDNDPPFGGGFVIIADETPLADIMERDGLIRISASGDWRLVSAVPEPTSFLLALSATLSFVFYRDRRRHR
jgi:hypothetical protein